MLCSFRSANLVLACSLGFLLGAPVSAAQAARQVEHRLMCNIDALGQGEAGRFHIACGSQQGLRAGIPGTVFVRRPAGDVMVGGRVQVETVSEQGSWVRAVGAPIASANTDGMVDVLLLLPEDGPRGELFDLYLLGIRFLDNHGQPLATLEQILGGDYAEAEQAALAGMVEAGHEVAEFTTEMTERISHGKWSGDRITSILEQSQPEDYRAFLRFVRDYPGKYIGKSWKISETYATWLVNDAPLSHEDRLNELMSVVGGPGFADLLAQIPEEEAAMLFPRLRKEIESLSATNQGAAEWRLKMLETMLTAYSEPSALLKAELEYARGLVLALQGNKRREATEAYRRAADLYGQVPRSEETTDPLDRIVCLNNEAGIWFALGEQDEVLSRVTEILAQAAALRRSPPNAEVADHVSLSEAFARTLAARIFAERGDHRRAIRELTPLLDSFAAVGAPGFRAREMEVIQHLAQAHQKLGEVDAAVRLWQRAEQRAAELGARDKQAEYAWTTGKLWLEVSNPVQAATDFERSARYAAEAGDQASEARALTAAEEARLHPLSE